MPTVQSKTPGSFDAGALAVLRDRLVALRDDTLRQLAAADHLDAGLVALLGYLGTALIALEFSELITSEGSGLEFCPSSRGGDPHAEQRRWRDRRLCALARLSAAPGMSVEAMARELVDRARRHRPASDETNPARLLLSEIVESGLPIPGPDRLARIIRRSKSESP